MRAAASSIVLLMCLAGCGERPQPAETNNAAATDIETLPADESMATDDELASEPINESAPQE